MKPSKLSFNKAFPLAVEWIKGSESRIAFAEEIALLLDAQAEEAARIADSLADNEYGKICREIATAIRSTLKGGKS